MSKAWAENMVDEYHVCLRTRFVNTTLSDVEVFARTCVGVIVVTLLAVKFWVL